VRSVRDELAVPRRPPANTGYRIAARANARIRVLALTCAVAIAAASCSAKRERAVSIYAGPYSDNSLPEEIALAQPLAFEDATLVALALGQVVYEPSRHARWEVEANVVQWFGEQDHQEINGLILLRWMTFPWDAFLDTSFAFGNGLSFATSEPDLEEQLHPDTGTSQVLYYIAVEFDFALPRAEHWSTILRVHHRSGVFGLVNDVNGGSNALTLGLRYAF